MKKMVANKLDENHTNSDGLQRDDDGSSNISSSIMKHKSSDKGFLLPLSSFFYSKGEGKKKKKTSHSKTSLGSTKLVSSPTADSSRKFDSKEEATKNKINNQIIGSDDNDNINMNDFRSYFKKYSEDLLKHVQKISKNVRRIRKQSNSCDSKSGSGSASDISIHDINPEIHKFTTFLNLIRDVITDFNDDQNLIKATHNIIEHDEEFLASWTSSVGELSVTRTLLELLSSNLKYTIKKSSDDIHKRVESLAQGIQYLRDNLHILVNNSFYLHPTLASFDSITGEYDIDVYRETSGNSCLSSGERSLIIDPPFLKESSIHFNDFTMKGTSTSLNSSVTDKHVVDIRDRGEYSGFILFSCEDDFSEFEKSMDGTIGSYNLFERWLNDSMKWQLMDLHIQNLFSKNLSDFSRIRQEKLDYIYRAIDSRIAQLWKGKLLGYLQLSAINLEKNLEKCLFLGKEICITTETRKCENYQMFLEDAVSQFLRMLYRNTQEPKLTLTNSDPVNNHGNRSRDGVDGKQKNIEELLDEYADRAHKSIGGSIINHQSKSSSPTESLKEVDAIVDQDSIKNFVIETRLTRPDTIHSQKERSKHKGRKSKLSDFLKKQTDNLFSSRHRRQTKMTLSQDFDTKYRSESQESQPAKEETFFPDISFIPSIFSRYGEKETSTTSDRSLVPCTIDPI